jgi:CBS domain-containing protein
MKTAEEILKEKNREMVCISLDNTVRDAVRIMNDNNIGAILVKKEDQIVGIWTERDLLHNTNLAEFNADADLIENYMTTGLHKVSHDTSILKINEMFLGLFIRHILVEKEGVYIGLLSIGDVLRATLIEQDRQIKSLNKIASWEYYENWGWDRRNREVDND